MLMMPARPGLYLAIIAALLFSSYLSARPQKLPKRGLWKVRWFRSTTSYRIRMAQ